MEPFFSRLETRAKSIDSLLCVGLDPHPDDLSELSGPGAQRFCLQIIEQTKEAAAAYKPNAAFFEALGAEGIKALQEVIAAVPDQIPVILDIKRGDISSTALAYAKAAYQLLGADAVTINPYLGRDAIEPFLEDPGKGAFVLCKTSNPGASDLQDLKVCSQSTIPINNQGFLPLYIVVAQLVQEWNQHHNLGLVVGATQVKSLASVRKNDQEIWILAPGIGAQGGDLEAALQAGLRKDGLGMLLPVSRGISRAENPRQAAFEIKDSINRVRLKMNGKQEKTNTRGFSYSCSIIKPSHKDEIAAGLLTRGCLQFGSFRLKSGIISPFYIDLRRLSTYPDFLSQVAGAYFELLKDLNFDCLAALPYAAMPIATAVSLLGKWPMIYPRKETKTYGTKSQVEGLFNPGETAVVLDDLITTGLSKLEGIKILTDQGLVVNDIVVLIDRSFHVIEELAEHGFQLHSYFSLAELLDFYESRGLVPRRQIKEVRAFLAAGQS
ncbi:MAG: orotidine-5'-phosphate decarboxylase [Chloroflexi bacterium]|nr:orotidine-5'-phosphate decarboxylase [Chloroflexota bacterium]